MLQISREFEFCSCHRLFKTVNEGHPCNCLHGHNYEGEVTIAADPSFMVDEMILDFSHLKGIIGSVVEAFDHRTLLHNEDPLVKTLLSEGQKVTIFLKDPTVEYMTRLMAYMIQFRVLTFFNSRPHAFSIRKFEVSMHETKKSKGIFTLNVEPVHSLDIEKLRSEAKAIVLHEMGCV